MPSREQRGGMEGKVAVIATDKQVRLSQRRTIAKAVRAVGLQREADPHWVKSQVRAVV
ncbi:MAG: hypothetical protein ABI456_18190 [Ktedonobacteraceae bacterium]|nr:hypothetical protein [Chloroflexota bacterium]